MHQQTAFLLSGYYHPEEAISCLSSVNVTDVWRYWQAIGFIRFQAEIHSQTVNLNMITMSNMSAICYSMESLNSVVKKIKLKFLYLERCLTVYADIYFGVIRWYQFSLLLRFHYTTIPSLTHWYIFALLYICRHLYLVKIWWYFVNICGYLIGTLYFDTMMVVFHCLLTALLFDTNINTIARWRQKGTGCIRKSWPRISVYG